MLNLCNPFAHGLSHEIAHSSQSGGVWLSPPNHLLSIIGMILPRTHFTSNLCCVKESLFSAPTDLGGDQQDVPFDVLCKSNLGISIMG